MQVGERVGDFTLTDHGGGSWTLSEHLGEVVLLIFHRHLM